MIFRLTLRLHLHSPLPFARVLAVSAKCHTYSGRDTLAEANELQSTARSQSALRMLVISNGDCIQFAATLRSRLGASILVARHEATGSNA